MIWARQGEGLTPVTGWDEPSGVAMDSSCSVRSKAGLWYQQQAKLSLASEGPSSPGPAGAGVLLSGGASTRLSLAQMAARVPQEVLPRIVCCLALLASCRPSVRATDELVLGALREPATVDPVFAVRSSDQVVARLLYPDLTVFDDRGQVVPRLSRTLGMVLTSTAGTRVRWHLRDGLKWSDGRVAGPEDYRFAHAIEANPDFETVNYEAARQVVSMRPLGRSSFEVLWRPAYGGVLEPRVHAILPKHRYPKPGRGQSRLDPRSMATVGPFQLKRWDRGVQLTLVPNPHWPGKKPHLSALRWRFFPGADGLESAFVAGLVDAIGPEVGLSPRRALRMAQRRRETHQLVNKPSGQLLQVGLRLSDPWLSKLEVRRALFHAVNRASVAKLAYSGFAQPAYGVFGPLHPLFRASSSIPKTAVPEGAPTLRLGFVGTSELGRKAAAVIQQNLAQAGQPLELEAKPLSVLFAQWRSGRGPAMILLAYRTRPDWVGHALLHSEGRLNHGGFARPGLDRWIEAAKSETDRGQWKTQVGQIDLEFERHVPLIPIVFKDSISLKPNRLRGWRPTGTSTPITWNAEAWRWSPGRDSRDGLTQTSSLAFLGAPGKEDESKSK